MWVPVSNVCSHCIPSSCLVTVGHRTRQTTDTRVHPRRPDRRVGYSTTPTRPQRFDGENSGDRTRHRTNTPRLIRSCVMQMAVTKDAKTASGNRYGVALCSSWCDQYVTFKDGREHEIVRLQGMNIRMYLFAEMFIIVTYILIYLLQFIEASLLCWMQHEEGFVNPIIMFFGRPLIIVLFIYEILILYVMLFQ